MQFKYISIADVNDASNKPSTNNNASEIIWFKNVHSGKHFQEGGVIASLEREFDTDDIQSIVSVDVDKDGFEGTLVTGEKSRYKFDEIESATIQIKF